MTKEYSEYHKEYYQGGKSKKKPIMFFAFILVLGFILWVAFSGNLGITGNTVRLPTSDNSFPLSLETNVPEIKLAGDYAKISMDVFSGQDLMLDGKRISLSKLSNSLILEGFSGKIGFNENLITLLDGKVSKIFIDGVPIANEKGALMRISSDSEIRHSSVAFDSDIYLKELKYVGYGVVYVSPSAINLNADSILIKNLFGKISIKDDKLFFDGTASDLSINGNDKKISISR